MRTNKDKEEFMKIFSINLRKSFQTAVRDFDKLQEIRLRAEAPMVFRFQNGVKYLGKGNVFCEDIKNAVSIPVGEIRETMEYISNYSMYAYEEEIKRGYLTIAGGHRIGIAGKMICENGEVRGVKHISYLCIRLAHEIIGCSDPVMEGVFCNGEFQDTLILSPPGFGKTTLLRDMIRNLSNGCASRPCGYQLGVVDERSEIAACYQGVPQNDIGMNSDVYDSCPKETGIRYFLRSMSPQVIAVDELSCEQDMQAVEQAFGCGCRILATTHAESLQELQCKQQWKHILQLGLFKRFVVIKNNEGKPEYQIIKEDERMQVRGG